MSRRIGFRALTTLASSAVLFVAGTAVADASVAHSVKAHAAATTVSVTAVEYKFKLSTMTASAPGTVTFKVTNKGKEPHDFKIDNMKTALLEPGKSATLTVKFAKAGKYPYLCTVPGHAALGMKGVFTVK